MPNGQTHSPFGFYSRASSGRGIGRDDPECIWLSLRGPGYSSNICFLFGFFWSGHQLSLTDIHGMNIDLCVEGIEWQICIAAEIFVENDFFLDKSSRFMSGFLSTKFHWKAVILSWCLTCLNLANRRKRFFLDTVAGIAGSKLFISSLEFSTG